MKICDGFTLGACQTLVWHEIRAFPARAFKPAIRYFSVPEIVDELYKSMRDNEHWRKVLISEIGVMKRPSVSLKARTETGRTIRICSIEVVWDKPVEVMARFLHREDLMFLPRVLRDLIVSIKRARRARKQFVFSFPIK